MKMKARIPNSAKFSKKQQEAINKLIKEQYEKEAQDIIRRVYKLLCVTMNEEHGHGKTRCLRTIDKIARLSEEHKHDEVFWYHVDKVVIEQMGIPFECEDYERMERQ